MSAPPLDIDAINARARAATQGQLYVDRPNRSGAPTPQVVRAPRAVVAMTDIVAHCTTPEDAAHIATSSPSTVLALTARIAELEAGLIEACDQIDAITQRRDCAANDTAVRLRNLAIARGSTR